MSILLPENLNIRSGLKQLLAAQPCLLCGTMSREGLCCTACNADLVRLAASHCPNCALPTLTGEVCGQCLQQPPHFDHAVAAFSYSFPVNQLIKALKFHERLILVNFLADELAQHIVARPDMLIALPLHPVRLRERGFNQSHLLALRISAQLNIPLLSGACQRVRDTPPQSTLPLKERDKNMRQAFAVAPDADVLGKHVAIVDDVMTSGASIGALAHALKLSGASKVSAWVVARTLPHG